jgi:hypothetical protein
MSSDQAWLNTWLQAKTVVVPLQQRSVTTLQWNEVEGRGMQASSKPCTAAMLEQVKQQLDKLMAHIAACREDTKNIKTDQDLKQAYTLKVAFNCIH